MISDRGGGATVGESTYVRLASPGSKIFPDAGGRVFAYDGANPGIAVKWIDAKTLQITCPKCSPEHVYLKVAKDQFISIVYSE